MFLAVEAAKGTGEQETAGTDPAAAVSGIVAQRGVGRPAIFSLFLPICVEITAQLQLNVPF